jgi:hypothetical protein
LVLDGVKYFNHLLVQYDMLANYEAKIECWKIFFYESNFVLGK